jgi:hypothetical protein
VSTRPALFAGESLAKNIAYSIYGIINLIGLGLLMQLADSMPIQLHQFVRQHMDDVYVKRVEYILVFFVHFGFLLYNAFLSLQSY